MRVSDLSDYFCCRLMTMYSQTVIFGHSPRIRYPEDGKKRKGHSAQINEDDTDQNRIERGGFLNY
jgi:hypothetical protein